jgi:hypothetical protein
MLQTFFGASCKYQHLVSYHQKSEFQIRHPYKGAESTGCLVLPPARYIYIFILTIINHIITIIINHIFTTNQCTSTREMSVESFHCFVRGEAGEASKNPWEVHFSILWWLVRMV